MDHSMGDQTPLETGSPDIGLPLGHARNENCGKGKQSQLSSIGGDPVIVTGAPEYVSSIPDHPFDGYYVDLDANTIEWRFSATDFPGIYWPQEVEVLGIVFTDAGGTMDGFQSLQLIESQTSYDVDWTSIDFGVLNEDQFFINLGPVTGTDNIFGNADGFVLEMSFVPAPASGFLLLGVFAGRRRRN